MTRDGVWGSVWVAGQPLLGLACGVAAAAVAAGVAQAAPPLGAPAGVLALEALARARPRRALAAVAPGGAVVAAALLAVKIAAAAGVPPRALGVALALAPMLGRWAVVVLSYGGTTLTRGPEDALPGRAGFAEFGWASLIAFAVTMSVAEAIGLVLLLVAALLTLGVRVEAHRRAGGVRGAVARAAGEGVETAVLALLALLPGVS